MAYKSYSKQILEHLAHLQSNGLDVSELKIIPKNSPWTRCYPIGESVGRGEAAYASNINQLNNDLLGIQTSFRGPKGSGSFQTYGLGPDNSNTSTSIHLPSVLSEKQEFDTNDLHEQAARKAYGFWKHSSLSGRSDYLERKGVGSYGVRFQSSEKYGNTAVVPMLDRNGRLWNRQLLNPDGTKLMAKDGRTDGLFHKLQEPVNGQPIGIAESYVTAATCYELIKFPVVCAFSCENLVAVTDIMLSLFPASLIILFADNDRHLVKQGIPNKGVLKAQEAKKLHEPGIVLVIPDFGDCIASKEASDWNDLVRLKGRDHAKAQVAQKT